jgi:multimeric flavodoxin WrbA
MEIIAINGSPRKIGNTSNIVRTILEGAQTAGASVTEVRLHDINLKGCMGCLSCRENPGVCKQEDDLSHYLEALKSCKGYIIGSPIYMFHVTGQMKMFVDRLYSLYVSRENEPGVYDSALPPGKNYALVTSQGHPDRQRFDKSIRWLAGMTGVGLGATEIGRIVHSDSHMHPAKTDQDLLAEARAIGEKLVSSGFKTKKPSEVEP